jgi:hypothetical protein
MHQLTPHIRIAQRHNNETLTAHHKLMGAIGYILNNYEEVKGTRFYSQKVRNLGDKFYKALEEREAFMTDNNTKSVDFDQAMQQMDDSYQVFENMLNTMFQIPDSKKEQFSYHMEELIRNFSK